MTFKTHFSFGTNLPIMTALNQILTCCCFSWTLLVSATCAQQAADSSQFQPLPKLNQTPVGKQGSVLTRAEQLPFASLPTLESGGQKPAASGMTESAANAEGSISGTKVWVQPAPNKQAVPSGNQSLEHQLAEQFARAYQDPNAQNIIPSESASNSPFQQVAAPVVSGLTPPAPLNANNDWAPTAVPASPALTDLSTTEVTPSPLAVDAESAKVDASSPLNDSTTIDADPSLGTSEPSRRTSESSLDAADSLPMEDASHHDLNNNTDNLGGLMDPEQLDWWNLRVIQGIFVDSTAQTVDLNSLVYQALQNSPRIQAISQAPLIRELQVIEANSVFDPVGFVRNSYNDRNDPVGNTLVTGGPPFLRDNIWNGDFGVKRKTRTGAKVEMGQKLGFQNSNSRFFLPQDQGTATLALNVTQPLLRGRGTYINESQILIAQANSGVAWNTFSEELQDELQQVVQGFWRLYYDRSLYLQKKRNVERGQQILDILQARKELDSMPSQIARARSAVELRKTELANALRDIRNSETEIRRRIADRDWMTAQTIELVPGATIAGDPNEIPLEQIVHTALENRPEIKEALQRAKVAGIQNQISENDLLPELSLLVGGYVSALNPESGVLQSWADQFGNRPGYNAGLNFEMPYGNRAARSRYSQQKLQLTKIKAEVDETMQQVIAEAQFSYRRVQSAIQTRHSALVSIEAARADLAQQASRWEQFGLVEGDFAEGQSPVILLNQVLDAQERLVAAELILAQADLELKVSEVALQRTMGTMLMYQNVQFSMGADRDQPYMNLDRPESAN